MANYTFQTYFLIQILPGVLPFGVASILAFAILFIASLSYCLCGKCKSVCKFVDKTTNYVFKNTLEKQKDVVNNEQVTTVCDFKASGLFMYWLFAYLVELIGIAILVAWDSFLLEESSDCNPDDIDLTCFSSHASSSDLPLNCSDTHYLEANNITSFTCFKLAFNIGKASGAAVGIFTIAERALPIFMWIILYISNGETGKWCQWLCTFFVQLGLLVVGYIILFILLYAAPSPLIKLLEHYEYSAFKIVGIYVTLIFCILTPWCTLEKIEDGSGNQLLKQPLLQDEDTSMNKMESMQPNS